MSTPAFIATKHRVSNRGVPPDAFLAELLAWGKTADLQIVARNAAVDIYSFVAPELGPWESDQHRLAVMLEVLRVLAGFESSWNWNEGVDTSNPDSDTAVSEEAGAFQVSADSMNFGDDLRALVQSAVGNHDGIDFQRAMKANHPFAIEYAARLLRHTTRHNGPVRDKLINPWLQRAAVKEFQLLLTS